MQDQQGDLATLAEEAAQGLRTVKAFGRRRQMSTQFEAGARLVHDTAVGKARLLASTWARFDLVPNVTLAIVLVGGAYAVASGGMTIGGLVAFVSLELMLIWPIDALGWIIANLQESMTAADRIYEVLDSDVEILDRPGAITLDRGGVQGGVRFEGVTFAFPDADGAGAAGHRPRHPARRDGRPRRRHRQRQVGSDRTGTPALRRHRPAASPSTATTSATSSSTTCAT